jgi:ATP-dependent DNA helicase RecQ
MGGKLPGSVKPSVAAESWEGVDRTLFESLKLLRRKLADEMGVPAYIVFSDASLRDMARQRPQTLDEFRKIRGVGDRKTEDFGEEFIELIADSTGN